MRKRSAFLSAFLVITVSTFSSPATAQDQTLALLDGRFNTTIRPFLQTYCVSCHGKENPDGEFDLTAFSSMSIAIRDIRHSNLVLTRLKANEMPPKDAVRHPSAEVRKQAIEWFQAVKDYETKRTAGDPGLVLARRLSNSEYDYTVRDLTGVDLHPTREFPVDPSNTAGFDNSGESLVMSPALMNKYLKAAREVADHMYLKTSGFGFAPRSMLSETDRDKFCELQIVNLYRSQNTDYADYFQTAWRYKNRAALGKPQATLADFAAEYKVSPKYLGKVWSLLEETKEDVGPVAKLQTMWRAMPAPVANQPHIARQSAEQMREWVIQLRRKIEPRFTSPGGGRGGGGGQAMPMWVNRQYAINRMTFDPVQLQVEGEAPPATQEAAPPTTTPARGGRRGGRGAGVISNERGDPDLAVPAGQRARYEASFAKFCAVFPDRFYTQQRGTNYFNEGNETGRFLSAGFLNRMGYFRDDIPLYELVLDEKQQQELDHYWRDMDFIANVTRRTYLQSFDAGSGQARALLGEDVNAAPDDTMASEPIINKYKQSLLANATNPVVIKAIEDHYGGVNETIRWTERTRIAAEPSHLQALLDFAARAYRRPLKPEERDDLLAYYKSVRETQKMDHESAVREAIVYVLVSPDMTYRIDLVQGASGVQPLSDYDLASRLSYFLWSSMPDKELLDHAAKGDLHDPKVIAAQAKRMLKDSRIRGLAVEFGGNWLGYRRFEDINTVDRGRFPAFSNELRDAMFEEPVQFLLDVIQNNRSILDCVYGNDTFVNPVLAKHYGMPDLASGSDEWVRIADANKYERGGLLPMAAFLTRNSPGLRTSPVKRGNWIVRNILGEVISPPPEAVPELPQDEAKFNLPLRQMLVKHREDPNCAACHAKFDSLGLVFEGFGPIGERREKDLAGQAVDSSATFPGGGEGVGLEGVRKYIREKRQDDFINNFSAKLLVYALGRSQMSSDDLLVEQMHAKLVANGYKFDTMIESIVTSPQFLNKRGRGDLAER